MKITAVSEYTLILSDKELQMLRNLVYEGVNEGDNTSEERVFGNDFISTTPIPN